MLGPARFCTPMQPVVVPLLTVFHVDEVGLSEFIIVEGVDQVMDDELQSLFGV